MGTVNSIAIYKVTPPFPNNPIGDLLITLNAKLVVGGDFDEFDGTPQYGLIRLNPNGSKDVNFSVGLGFPYIDGSGGPIYDSAGSYISTVNIQSDGKILVGGRFTQYQNIQQKYFIRLHQNGTYDADFSINIQGTESGLLPPSAYPVSVNSIIIQPDNKIAYFGLFVREVPASPSFYYNICIGRTLSKSTNFTQSLPTIGSNILIGSQTVNGRLTVNDLIILSLPTSDPGINGALYNDAGFLKISAY